MESLNCRSIEKLKQIYQRSFKDCYYKTCHNTDNNKTTKVKFIVSFLKFELNLSGNTFNYSSKKHIFNNLFWISKS